MHVDSWREGYRGLLPDRLLAGLSIEARTEMWRGLLAGGQAHSVDVAVAGEEVVGFISYGGRRDSALPASVGEIYALYVAPNHWSRGAGSALLARAGERLRESGMREAVAWVLAGNERGSRFYERSGWSRDGGRRTRMAGLPDADLELRELRYRRVL